MCGSTSRLEFAHIIYTDDSDSRSTIRTAREVMEHPDHFILLCKSCHRRPEKYLKELIDLRAKVFEVPITQITVEAA